MMQQELMTTRLLHRELFTSIVSHTRESIFGSTEYKVNTSIQGTSILRPYIQSEGFFYDDKIRALLIKSGILSQPFSNSTLFIKINIFAYPHYPLLRK